MKKHTIQRDNESDIRFTGERVASAETSPETARSDYSGQTGRWQELELYKTEAGNYVCQRVCRTQWQGEHDLHEAAICNDEKQVIEFFGTGRLAKELYEAASIECIEDVE